MSPVFTRAASAWRGCRTWPRPPARCGGWSPAAPPPAPGGRNHSPAQEIQDKVRISRCRYPDEDIQVIMSISADLILLVPAPGGHHQALGSTELHHHQLAARRHLQQTVRTPGPLQWPHLARVHLEITTTTCSFCLEPGLVGEDEGTARGTLLCNYHCRYYLISATCVSSGSRRRCPRSWRRASRCTAPGSGSRSRCGGWR